MKISIPSLRITGSVKAGTAVLSIVNEDMDLDNLTQDELDMLTDSDLEDAGVLDRTVRDLVVMRK